MFDSTFSILLLSCLLGTVYGFLFTRQQMRLFESPTTSLLLFCLPLMRLGIAGFIIYYLLRLPVLLSILSLGIFISSWWVVIVVLKERLS